MQKQKLLAITGPTASGKTKIALELAQDLRAEIISSDNLLVYTDIDIVTAKPNITKKSYTHESYK